MTEIEYVIANFAERLAVLKGKRIVLHGSRNYAEAIIDNFKDSFNFIGVMSMDSLDGENFHGLKVLHDEDLFALHIDAIILTERVKYAVEAFNSIRRICRKNNIAIYNMYGLDEFSVHYEAENTNQLTLEHAKQLCEPYDIIAFEVMDTLFFSSIFAANMAPRKILYDLIAQMREKGKVIRYSLRKSFPTDIQVDALKKFGLLLDENNEIVYRVGEDLSFRQMKENNLGKRILYFGNGLANEFILPRCYGIDTFRFVGIHNHGLLLSEEKNTENVVYFEPDWKQKIENQIIEKTLVSFDIFDTLLVRKTLYPHDVFYLVEQRALHAGYNVNNFVSARIQAEEEQPLCNIDMIYSWLKEYYEWDDEVTRKIREIELKTEQEVLIPRTEIVNLLHFAQKAGKQIVLTSDMYLPETILKKILEEKGISGYEKLFVSCEVKRAKHTGLYKELLKICSEPSKILHIGDNPVADGSDCKALGITAALIPSALDMALNRGWGDAVQTASNLLERSLLGLIISNIFQDPFQQPDLKKYPVEARSRRFGNSVIGPLASGYLTWLIQKLREESFHGVLFLARDGWLFYNIYRKSLRKLGLPLPIYYYANRRSAFLGCADSEHECGNILELRNFYGASITDTIKNVYQIPTHEILPYLKDDGASDYIEKHMELIKNKAEETRKGYLQYSKKCGMVSGNRYAVCDFIAMGNTQHYLSKVLPFSLQGYYFAKYSSASVNTDKIEYYLQNKASVLLKGYVERLEPFITSMEPSQNCITSKGLPVFAEEYRNSQELQDIATVLKTAEVFSVEFFETFYQEGQVISSSLIEAIYAAEDYYITQHTVYDDWLGVPINKRKDTGEEESDEKL
jgi:predicted HAD superfamily hydrolase